MSTEQYCEPCKRLLCGDVKPHYERWTHIAFTHHPDAESFKKALELPCFICTLAWSVAQDPPSWLGSISLGTTAKIYHDKFEVEFDDDIRNIRFQYGSEEKSSSDSIILVPWETMVDYQVPPLLSSSTGSESALDFLVGKYQECRDKHVGCRLQTSPTIVYPSRLIDVGESQDSVFLHDTQRLDERGPYTCLSHCWGQKQPLMLTKETKSILHDGMPVSALPKTFRDAVFVTRLLGVRFLWIDSLCIMQDSKADWSIEAGRMSDIYSQAVCTIAATAAENSDCGLFFDRDPTLLQPRRVEVSWPTHREVKEEKFAYPLTGSYWCDIQNLTTRSIEWAPLNPRAWVCQERHLSPRIMHFSKTQLFWECHKDMASENYPIGLPEWATPFLFDSASTLKNQLHQYRLRNASAFLERSVTREEVLRLDKEILSDTEFYLAWALYRKHYSRCALTKEEDKLVAIQGVAQHFGDTLGDQLIAGLWSNRLLEELCWFPRRFTNDPPIREPGKWRAPTWSWASSNAMISVSRTSRDHIDCDHKQIWGDLESIDVKADASGRLEHASLQIRCKLICVAIEPGLNEYSLFGFKFRGTVAFRNSTMVVDGSGERKLKMYMDRPDWEERRHLHMLIIQRCEHRWFIEQDKYRKDVDVAEGILLVPQHGRDNVFERVGQFMVEGGSNVLKLLEEYETAESRVITLI